MTTKLERIVRRLRIWWEIRRLHIAPPVEYCQIKGTRPLDQASMFKPLRFPIIGWIPRQVYEDITGDVFTEGSHNYIRVDHSAAIQKHPLFVKDEDFDA